MPNNSIIEEFLDSFCGLNFPLSFLIDPSIKQVVWINLKGGYLFVLDFWVHE